MLHIQRTVPRSRGDAVWVALSAVALASFADHGPSGDQRNFGAESVTLPERTSFPAIVETPSHFTPQHHDCTNPAERERHMVNRTPEFLELNLGVPEVAKKTLPLTSTKISSPGDSSAPVTTSTAEQFHLESPSATKPYSRELAAASVYPIELRLPYEGPIIDALLATLSEIPKVTDWESALRSYDQGKILGTVEFSRNGSDLPTMSLYLRECGAMLLNPEELTSALSQQRVLQHRAIKYLAEEAPLAVALTIYAKALESDVLTPSMRARIMVETDRMLVLDLLPHNESPYQEFRRHTGKPEHLYYAVRKEWETRTRAQDNTILLSMSELISEYEGLQNSNEPEDVWKRWTIPELALGTVKNADPTELEKLANELHTIASEFVMGKRDEQDPIVLEKWRVVLVALIERNELTASLEAATWLHRFQEGQVATIITEDPQAVAQGYEDLLRVMGYNWRRSPMR